MIASVICLSCPFSSNGMYSALICSYMCDCAYKYAQRDGKMSENNDGYSVSYDTGKSLDSMLYEIAEVYLVNTGLMSLAVDDNADECNDYNL